MVERTTRCRVLVVHDDAISCQAMRALLVRWGHDVATCATVAEAVAGLSHQAPDRLILDVGLDDSEGIELLRQIRRRELLTRVAVVTVPFDPRLSRELRELKPDVIFTKPVDVAQLKRWLSQACQDRN